jgi:GNAT superfamily N-acetyltransferase
VREKKETTEKLAIKQATHGELAAILEMEAMLIGNTEDHTDFIERSIVAGECLIAVMSNEVVGAAMLNYSFYHQGFVALLNVHPDYRRQGIATALIRHMESVCTTKKSSLQPMNQTYRPGKCMKPTALSAADISKTLMKAIRKSYISKICLPARAGMTFN